MNEHINLERFVGYLLDDEALVNKGAKIVQAVLSAQSPRLSEIAEKMAGKRSCGYKAIQRFIQKADLKQALKRLYQEDAEFVIGDVTEMERYRAPKTPYVGALKDGKTPGYWLLALSTPCRGRSLPFWFEVYSSRTIAAQITSRNQEHYRCLEAVKPLLRGRPVVFDREFSYEQLLETLRLEDIPFASRLNVGDPRKPVRLVDADGEPVQLLIQSGQTVIRPNVYYLGKVKVNLIGHWRKGLAQPLWLITSLAPEKIYHQRMKIEQTFRDCKDRLHLTKLMNKKQERLEQMIALVLLACAVGVWLGEALRDVLCGGVEITQVAEALLHHPPVDPQRHPQWLLYFGLFVLLKQKFRFSRKQLEAISKAAAAAFGVLVYAHVRTFVRRPDLSS